MGLVTATARRVRFEEQGAKKFGVIAFLGYRLCVMGCKRVCGGGIELRSVWAGRSSLAIGNAGGLFVKRTHDHATIGNSLSTAARSGPSVLFSSALLCCLKRRDSKSPLHTRVCLYSPLYLRRSGLWILGFKMVMR